MIDLDDFLNGNDKKIENKPKNDSFDFDFDNVDKSKNKISNKSNKSNNNFDPWGTSDEKKDNIDEFKSNEKVVDKNASLEAFTSGLVDLEDLSSKKKPIQNQQSSNGKKVIIKNNNTNFI